MDKLHTIAGLPRSGSTLLCNILNQNPEVFASSTSELPTLIGSMISWTNNSLDFKNLLNIESEKTTKRWNDTVTAAVTAWHGVHGVKHVFDKSRGWTGHPLVLQAIGDGKMIVMVRDLRDVAASCIKQSQKQPLIGGSNLVRNQLDELFNVQGVIGAPLQGIYNLLDLNADNVIFIKYEDLTSKTDKTIKKIYDECEIDFFLHNFNDIKNTSYDCDGFYLDKYPHKGCGKVEKSESNWANYLPVDVAQAIMQQNMRYNQQFGYR